MPVVCGRASPRGLRRETVHAGAISSNGRSESAARDRMTTATAPRISADRLRTALGTRDLKQAPEPAPRRHTALEALYPGREIENEYGHCFVVEWSFPLAHPHGRQPL